MMPLPTARSLRRQADQDRRADAVRLTYDDRFLRRKVLTSETGRQFLVDLAQTTSVNHGDAFALDTGEDVAIVAATEDLLEVTGPDLLRYAWHVGNRHTPCQIDTHRLVIQRDHVIRDMLGHLGATLREIHEPFTPEGGAYGHGRTHAHAH